MAIADRPRRRWYRFSLRTLFVLLTLFCVWLGVQVKWIRDRHEAVRACPAWIMSGPAPVTLQLFGERGALRIRLMGGGVAQIKKLQALFPEAESIEFTREGRDNQMFR